MLKRLAPPIFQNSKKTTLQTSLAYFLNLFNVQPRTAQFYGLGKRAFPASGKFQLSKERIPPYKGWTLFSSGLCGCLNYISLLHRFPVSDPLGVLTITIVSLNYLQVIFGPARRPFNPGSILM